MSIMYILMDLYARQKKYAKSTKGKEALARAQKKYYEKKKESGKLLEKKNNPMLENGKSRC